MSEVEFNQNIYEQLHWVPHDPTKPTRPHLGRIMRWNTEKFRAETLKNATVDLILPSCIESNLDDVVMTTSQVKRVELSGQAKGEAAELVNLDLGLMFETTEANQKILDPKGCKSVVSPIHDDERAFLDSIISEVNKKENKQSLCSRRLGLSENYCVVIGLVQCESCTQYSPTGKSLVVLSNATLGATSVPSLTVSTSFKSKYEKYSIVNTGVNVNKQIDQATKQQLPIIVGYYIRRFDISWRGVDVNRGDLGTTVDGSSPNRGDLGTTVDGSSPNPTTDQIYQPSITLL